MYKITNPKYIYLISMIIIMFNNNIVLAADVETEISEINKYIPSIFAVSSKNEIHSISDIDGIFQVISLNGEDIITKNTQFSFSNDYEFLTIYSSPDISSDIIAQIPSGTMINVYSLENNWYKIIYNSEYAYIPYDLSIALIEREQQVPINQKIISYAKQFLGVSYLYGGTNLSTGVDCSGFTSEIFREFGIDLNRTSVGQYSDGERISKKDLQTGDLVFFFSPISHVGIYMGDDNYIHCTDTNGKGVTITSLSSPFASSTYTGAVRVLENTNNY